MLLEQEMMSEMPESELAETRREASKRHFESMLATHEPERLRRGQIIQGEILMIDENLAIIDVGAKWDAIVPPQEMVETDAAFLEELNAGDQVHVYVTQTPTGDRELLVSLEKGLKELDWQRAKEALANEELLDLTVSRYNRGGLLVKFGRLEGFVPNSLLPSLKRIRDEKELIQRKTDLVGSNLPLKVIEIDQQRSRLVLSARSATRERRREQLEQMEVSQVLTGRVAHLVNFGAFVEIGSVTGLVHISELAWQHVDHPADLLSPGDEIMVQVKSIDVERERLSLSRKALLPSPWHQFAQRYQAGDLIEGEITAIVDFGAFVRLALGIEGLVHISEIDLPDLTPIEAILEPGEQVLVRVISIEPDQERLGLSLRRVTRDEQIAFMLARQESQPVLEEEE